MNERATPLAEARNSVWRHTEGPAGFVVIGLAVVCRVSSLAALALCFAARPATAADKDVIITDRPDFVDSSLSVGKGRFQFEASVLFARKSADGVREQTYTTPTLLRYGFADDWEWRLESDWWSQLRISDSASGVTTTERGFADLSPGVKWHVHDADKEAGTPSVAIIAHAALPSGARAVRGHSVRPAFKSVLEWELPHNFSIGTIPGLVYDTNDAGQRFVRGTMGVVLNKQWTEKFRTLVEAFWPSIASAENGGTVVNYKFAMAYLITNMVQIDSGAYRGWGKGSPDFAMTVGLSMKF